MWWSVVIAAVVLGFFGAMWWLIFRAVAKHRNPNKDDSQNPLGPYMG